MQFEKISKFKIVIYLSLAIVSFLAVDYLVNSNMLKSLHINEFILADALSYADERGSDCQSEIYMGQIDGINTAKIKAEEVWGEYFGQLGITEKDIKSQKPYVVYYDNESDAYMVHGSLRYSPFYNVKGGCAYVIFRGSDGKVLAIWHEK